MVKKFSAICLLIILSGCATAPEPAPAPAPTLGAGTAPAQGAKSKSLTVSKIMEHDDYIVLHFAEDPTIQRRWDGILRPTIGQEFCQNGKDVKDVTVGACDE